MAAGPVTMPPSTMALPPPPSSTMAPPPRYHYPRRRHRRRPRPPPRIRYIRRPPRVIRRPYPVPVPVTYEIQEDVGDLDCDVVKKIETEGEPTEFELKCVEGFEDMVEGFENIHQSNTNLIFAVLWGLIFVGFLVGLSVSTSKNGGNQSLKTHLPDWGILLVVLGFLIVNAIRAAEEMSIDQAMLAYSCFSGTIALFTLLSAVFRNTKVIDSIFIIIWIFLALWFGITYRTYKYYKNNPSKTDEVDIPESEID